MDIVRRNIKQIMKDQRIRNVDLAGKMGIAKQNISQILNGDQDLMLSTLQKIADSLNIPVSKLFEGEESLKSSKNMTGKVIFQIEIDENVKNNYLKMILGKSFIDELKK
ncbi:MAG: helix-turn-helix transcriptional regulator [Bacteroidetes bacterium]|nr:helix-turn-helix transcriptional regulator [Bacteroidota bacterium]